MDQNILSRIATPRQRKHLSRPPSGSGGMMGRWLGQVGQRAMNPGQSLLNMLAQTYGFEGAEQMQQAQQLALQTGRMGLPEGLPVGMGGFPVVGAKLVYHGTPNTWMPEPNFPAGRPRLDKIGTGEGAQVYGRGVYFAENENVARSYADALGSGNFGGENAPPDSIAGRLSAIWGDDGTVFTRGESDRNILDYAEKIADKDYWKNGARHYQFKDGSAIVATETGWDAVKESKQLYKSDLPDEQLPNLLDWDKPITEQPKSIQKAAEEIKGTLGSYGMSEARTGEQLIKEIEKAIQNHPIYINQSPAFGETLKGSREIAMEYLRSFNIPGLSYLDQGSRVAGEGTRNYVIWDQNILNRMVPMK